MDNQQTNEELPIRTEVNQAVSSYTTTDDVYKRREREAKKAQLEGWLELAAMGGGAYGLASIINNDPVMSELISILPGANRYKIKHEIAREKSEVGGFNPVDLTKHYKEQSFGRSVLSMVSSIEELSPFHVLKTLQLSNILEPLTDVSRKPKDIKITGSALDASINYYINLIRDSSGKSLEQDDLKHGLVLRDSKLYRYLQDGKTLDLDNPLLNYARSVTTHTKLGDSLSPNRILSKFANIFNTDLGKGAFNVEQIAIVGGKSKSHFAFNWADAIMRQSLEIGYKTLDNPLSGVEELFKASGANVTGVLENSTYKKIKSKLNLSLGTGGKYDLSTKESLHIMSRNIVTKGLVAYGAYQAVNQLLDKITPNNSAWHDGLLSGSTTTYANTRVGLAKLLADPFQRYKENQENAANGSTNLSTLIGFPLAGAVAFGSLPYYKRMYQSKTQGVEKASLIADEAIHTLGIGKTMTGALEKLGVGRVTQTKALAFKGGLLGAAVALPFLPGALIGQSSTELKKKYSGQELEANKANAHWMAGGGSWDGDQIKNFRPNRVARILADTKKESLYDGSNKKRRDQDPFYSPLRYLFNPYKFEEEHTQDMPYPVWGMNVDYGSFMGKIYQGTVGEIIKPTVINQQFLDESKQLSQTPLEATRGELRSRLQDKLDTLIGANRKPISGTLPSTSIHSVDNNRGGYAITYEPRTKDADLIKSGNMLAEESPSEDHTQIALSQTYNSFTDFTGLKGFTTSLAVNKLGYDPESTRRQLARSGESRSLSTDIINENMGDLFGLGEVQRRLVATSADSRVDEVNPMYNNVSPSWLPRDESKYYLDFSKGDYWNKVANGTDRLPGKGYEKLHPELKGMNPEDYPLVYQYKVLSDVAQGSPEQIALRDNLLEKGKEGKLTKEEEDIFYTSLTEEQEKSKKKQFDEYKTPEQVNDLSFTGQGMNKLWNTISHNVESPLEPLTPFRPGAKFVHKRTAIEDYEKTMLDGPDTAIWTNPYSHFIKPTANRIANLLGGKPFISDDVQEKNNVNEYFDNLGYLRARKNNKFNDQLRTVKGSIASGILDKDGMNKFKASLDDKEKVYVDSFAQAKTDKDRKRILEMESPTIGKAYKQIWRNLDVAERAKASGKDIDTAVKEAYVSDHTSLYQKLKDSRRTDYRSLKDKATQLAETGTINEDTLDKDVARVQAQAKDKAEEEATQYVESKTGMPSKNWVGWDSRLTTDDIKLRTLRMGKADTYDYGFWDGDVRRNDRITGLDGDSEVVTRLNKIKRNMRQDILYKREVEDSLFQKGFLTKRITLTDATRNDIDVRVDNNE